MDAEAEIDIKPNRRHRALDELTPELFWSRIQKPVGCWLYIGAKESNGYGYLMNPFGDKPKFLTAHRAAWIYAHGPIPEGMLVLHRCDVRACVNPEHLFLGTDADNSNDKAEKGRSKGLLKPDEVREIRKAIADCGGRRGINVELARRFNVRPEVICALRTGINYKYVK